MTTATTLTLTAFLLARIEEDEAAAREAAEMTGDARWQAAAADYEGIAVWSASAGNTYGYGTAETAHIARHDPARVLAECAAKRAIVEFHKAWPVLVETPPRMEQVGDDLSSVTLRMTQEVAWATEQQYRERFGTEPPTGPMLRALAAVYSDHPDYDERWRP